MVLSYAMLLTGLGMILVPITAFETTGDLSRLNYGTYFKKIRDLAVNRLFWRHTVSVSLPDLQEFDNIPVPHCNFTPSCDTHCSRWIQNSTDFKFLLSRDDRYYNICQSLCSKWSDEDDTLHFLKKRDDVNKLLCPLLRNSTIKLNVIRKQFMQSINKTITDVKDLIPAIDKNLSKVKSLRSSRTKRALKLFNFIYKNIFGLATNQDMQQLTNDFAKMHKNMDQIRDATIRNFENMKTFASVTNHEINKINEHMNSTDILLRNLAQLSSYDNDYVHRQYLMVINLFRDIYTNVAFESFMTKLQDMFSYVNTGKLPPFLMPTEYLQRMFTNINFRLMQSGSALRVPILTPHHIFTDLKVLTRFQQLLLLRW